MDKQANAFVPGMAGGPDAIGAAFGDVVKSLSGLGFAAPELAQVQSDYLKSATEVWNQTLKHNPGGSAAPSLADKRFSAPEWLQNPAAGYAAQMYLLNSRTLMQMADAVQGEPKTKARIRFAVQQWVDASAPCNVLAFNPEALKKAVDSKGESIAAGLSHLWEDLQKGHVSQTESD